MKTAASIRLLTAGLLGLASLGAAGEAAADGFTVKPTRVVLTPERANEILTIRNDGTEPVRLQLSAFAWDQKSSGEMKLSDTKDVVFFPPFLTLAPGEQRKVRVGAATTFDTVEKSYRLFVEQLPPLHEQAGTPGTIAVLTRMGVPVFLQPERPDPEAALRLSLRGRVLVAALENRGNSYFVPGSITLRGRGRDGRPLFEKALSSWYVLAGGKRVFALQLAPSACKRLATLELEADVGGETLSRSIETGAASCKP